MAFISSKPLAALILIAAAIRVAQASADTVTVNKAEYGEKWPFTVTQVELACEIPPLMTVTANGKTYALNGSARSHAKEHGWAQLEEIWRIEPEYEGTGTVIRMDISDLNERAVELCAK